MENNAFQTRDPAITGNPRLRTPHREAYARLAVASEQWWYLSRRDVRHQEQ